MYSELSNYEIENINLSFDQGVVIDNKNVIKIPETYRVFPNKIITDINYEGEFIESDNDEAYLYEEEEFYEVEEDDNM